jgi:hypothetical protein
MNNLWGESDDEPVPAWMDPKTYRNGNQPTTKSRQSLEEACKVALTKPAIPIIIKEPNIE